jgi:hypothetical protein
MLYDKRSERTEIQSLDIQYHSHEYKMHYLKQCLARRYTNRQ